VRPIVFMLAICTMGVIFTGSVYSARPFARATRRTYPGLSAETEAQWKGPFFFIVLADPQFGFMPKEPEKELRQSRDAVKHISRLKPRFVIILGDITNGQTGSKGAQSELKSFKEIYGAIDPDIPLLLLPGNHDVGQKSNARSMKGYLQEFGDDYYEFWVGGVKGIVLNSQLIGEPSQATVEAKAQDEWLRRTLAASKEQKPVHTLLFQHQSWFLQKPDEKDAYYNIPKAVREPWLREFAKSRVTAVFAGHAHREFYGKYGNMEMITTSAIGRQGRVKPKSSWVEPGFRIVKVHRDRINHTYYKLADVPKKMDIPGLGK
jgi:serine/threonine-protein phosphatase CPPED1